MLDEQIFFSCIEDLKAWFKRQPLKDDKVLTVHFYYNQGVGRRSSCENYRTPESFQHLLKWDWPYENWSTWDQESFILQMNIFKRDLLGLLSDTQSMKLERYKSYLIGQRVMEAFDLVYNTN